MNDPKATMGTLVAESIQIKKEFLWRKNLKFKLLLHQCQFWQKRFEIQPIVRWCIQLLENQLQGKVFERLSCVQKELFKCADISHRPWSKILKGSTGYLLSHSKVGKVNCLWWGCKFDFILVLEVLCVAEKPYILPI